MNGMDYQRGYDDGLSEGEARGWKKAIEAAAHLMERSIVTIDVNGEILRNYSELDFFATAIRKLKKP